MSDTEKQTDIPKEDETKGHPKVQFLLPIDSNQKQDLLKVSNKISESMSLGTSYSSLPVDSARLVTLGDKKRKIGQQFKFINKKTIKDVSSLEKIGKIKNLIYRNKIDRVISEEKTRLQAFEETMMFQRQRRFNKVQNIKKCQRSRSPSPLQQKHPKKFKRTQDKKKQIPKKFKRHHDLPEQMNEEGKLLHAKLIKKLREDPHMQQFSRIPQRLGKETDSVIVESEMIPQSSVGNEANPSFEQNINIGILEHSDLSGLSSLQADIIT